MMAADDPADEVESACYPPFSPTYSCHPFHQAAPRLIATSRKRSSRCASAMVSRKRPWRPAHAPRSPWWLDLRMPSIVIVMLYRDHEPPHFHASYAEFEIIVGITDGLVTGRFPRRALVHVLEWWELHRPELLAN